MLLLFLTSDVLQSFYIVFMSTWHLHTTEYTILCEAITHVHLQYYLITFTSNQFCSISNQNMQYLRKKVPESYISLQFHDLWVVWQTSYMCIYSKYKLLTQFLIKDFYLIIALCVDWRIYRVYICSSNKCVRATYHQQSVVRNISQ